MAGDTELNVLVAIPTFRRPVDLQRLLGVIGDSLDAALQSAECTRADVLVVDNDPAGTAAAMVIARADATIRAVVEPGRGLATVRNRALREANDYDVMVFIDDDETPAVSDWLVRLLRTMRTTNANLVAGPVQTVVDGEMDPWIEAGGFYARAHRRHLVTGDEISSAATNNLLLDLNAVRRAGVTFDERFGASGGEDSLFTGQLKDRDLKLVWCADALVYDHLLPSRQNRRFAVSRVRSMASTGVRVALVRSGRSTAARVRIRARFIASGCAHLLRGGAMRTYGRVVRSLRWDARGAGEMARGVGEFLGSLGAVTRTYVSTDPTRRGD